MEAIWRYFKVQLPGYLRTLPLPKSLAEIPELTRDDWLTLMPFLLFLIILLYLAVSPLFNLCQGKKQLRPRINRKQELDKDKVTNTIDIEDLGKKIEANGKKLQAFCRCWKSKKFPYCDGSHTNHNKATGDNVGPLLIRAKKTD